MQKSTLFFFYIVIETKKGNTFFEKNTYKEKVGLSRVSLNHCEIIPF